LTSAVQALDKVYSARREMWRQALKRFLDREVTLGEAETYQAECSTWQDRKARNAIASVVETVHSHCTTMKPRPAFRTVAGSAKLQERVRLLQRAIDALLDRQDIEKQAARVCLDALLGGDGHVRVGVHDGEPIAQRVAPYRLLLDPAETVLAKPLTYYHVFYADLDALREQYPNSKGAPVSGAEPILGGTQVPSGSRVVQCVEAIRVPATRDGKGKRVVFTAAGVLEEGPYTYPEAPFFSLLWLQNPESPYGIGVPERLAGVQQDIDDREDVIRDHEMAVAGTWLLPQGCGLVPSDFDNRRKALTYTLTGGQKPEYVYPQAVATDVYNSRESSVQAAYQFSGLNQMAATGEKPGGVTAAAALRRLEVVGSKRFARFYQDYQSMLVWIGKMFAYIIARDPNVRKRSRLLVGDAAGCELVRLSQLRVDPDLVDVRVRVSSFTATDEPGILAEITEHFNSGFLTREQALRLWRSRDLDAEVDMMTAPTDLVDSLLQRIVKDEVYVAPEQWFDLQLCFDRAVQLYQRLLARGEKPARLALLRDWIRAVMALQGLTVGQYPGAPPAGPPGAPAAGPPAQGMGPMPPQGVATPVGMAPPPGPVPA
jgi:hypothetical protein